MKKPPIRFWIGVMIFMTTYINYTMRVNMSVSIIGMVKPKKGVKMIPECHKSNKQSTLNSTVSTTPSPNGTATGKENDPDLYEWDQVIQNRIIASYFWGYVPFCLPAGIIAEWIGPFNTIFYAHILSGILNSTTAFVAQFGWEYVMITRVLIGALGGLIYPALQVLISKWAPPNEKGKFVSALMGNTLGTCITWPLVGYVTEELKYGWGFHVISLQVIVYSIAFFLIVSDSPDKNRFISEEEKKYIADAQGDSVTKQKEIPEEEFQLKAKDDKSEDVEIPMKRPTDLEKVVPPYLAMMLSIPFWALTVAHIGNLWGLYLQITGAPKFLSDVLDFDLKKSGGVAALAPLCRLFGGMGFGALGDYLRKKEFVKLTTLRKSFILFSHILPAGLLYCMMLVGCNVLGAVSILVLSQGLNGAAVVTNLQNPQDLAPNFSGTIFGIISLIGGCTGFITPEITAALTKEHVGLREWQINFAIGASVYLFCGIFFVLLGSANRQPWNDMKGAFTRKLPANE